MTSTSVSYLAFSTRGYVITYDKKMIYNFNCFLINERLKGIIENLEIADKLIGA